MEIKSCCKGKCVASTFHEIYYPHHTQIIMRIKCLGCWKLEDIDLSLEIDRRGDRSGTYSLSLDEIIQDWNKSLEEK